MNRMDTKIRFQPDQSFKREGWYLRAMAELPPPEVQTSAAAALTARPTQAVISGDQAAVTALLDGGAKDPFGAALLAASDRNDAAIIRLLIPRIRYTPEVDNYATYVICPLLKVVSEAIQYGDFDLVRWLVEDVIKPWQPRFDGGDASVMLAVFAEHYEIAD